jgi:hypothetical protein
LVEEEMCVLVTVKAYPQPSRAHGETVCVAGVRIDDGPPRWIRIYPVAYRELSFADRFKKYQFMKLKGFQSNSDPRPESYKPIIPSAILGEVIDTDRGTWRRRWEYLQGLAGATTACELLARQSESDAPSLGLIKPHEVLDLEVEPNYAFSAQRQLLADLAASGDLFSESRAVLEPAPYRLKYRYRCLSAKPGSTAILSW